MKDDQQRPQDLSSLSYEEARDELAAIVASLEEGTSSLDHSLTLWERGEALAKRCLQWLDSAQVRLDSAGQDPDPQDPAGQSDEPVPDVADRGAGNRPTPPQTKFSSGASPASKEPDRSRTVEPAPASGANDKPEADSTTSSKKPKKPIKPAETQPKLRPVANPGPPPAAPTRGKPTDPPW